MEGGGVAFGDSPATAIPSVVRCRVCDGAGVAFGASPTTTIAAVVTCRVVAVADAERAFAPSASARPHATTPTEGDVRR